MTQPRVCIATGDYYRLGETFVNRHIAEIFGGSVGVITGRYHGENPLNKPVFERRQRAGGTAALLQGLLWHIPLNTLKHGTSRLPYGQAKSDLIAFLREHQVEVILAEFGTQSLALAPLANELNIPIFTYFRGTDASKQIQRPRIVKAYNKMMPRLAGVFSVSQFLLDNLARHGVTVNQNAHVVPSGVDIRRFVPGEKRPGSFLAVGRFVEKKAPQITLRAFAKAAQNHPDARLDFIGSGPLLEDCQKLAADMGVADQVTFHGQQTHEYVRQHLLTTEVFLQHSITAADGNTEGLPTAIQEALACGCITISTNHAGIPEAVEHGVNGYLVDEWDEEGFGQQIKAVLDQADRSAMATAARRTAEEKFDNDKGLARVERIILETIGRQG